LRSFFIASPVVWNSLPLHLRSPSISRRAQDSSFQTGLSSVEETELNWIVYSTRT